MNIKMNKENVRYIYMEYIWNYICGIYMENIYMEYIYMEYIYGILFSHEKGHPAMFDNMSQTERQISQTQKDKYFMISLTY